MAFSKPEAVPVLVYADISTLIDPRELRARLAAPLPQGKLQGQAEAIARLIEAGRYLQALEDDCPNARDLLKAIRLAVTKLARGAPQTALPDCEFPSLPARIPEGYAFYALYPECYAAAARQLGKRRDALVIGLRSIGTSLGACVSAALDAQHFMTLRPHGEPFNRTVEDNHLKAMLTSPASRDICIVDEGPGLSGSSFAGTARAIERIAPSQRVHFFTSHANGPGPAASDDTQLRFRDTPQHVADFDAVIRPQLAGWFEDVTGPALGPLRDLSAGQWRALAFERETDWPVSERMQERRKYLLHTEQGFFLLKFLGLGEIGEAKAAMSAHLSRSGLVPQHFAYRHGFSLERWHETRLPLDAARDRPRLMSAMQTYLACRAQAFQKPFVAGPSLAALAEMARVNCAEALGADAGRRLACQLEGIERYEGLRRRVASDNRMHLHEWVALADGRILKADAVDHHADHHILGAQDASFDIASASLLLGMDESETRAFAQAIAARSRSEVCTPLIQPAKRIWLTFEIGRLTMTLDGEQDPDERARINRRLQQFLHALSLLLEPGSSSRERELQRLMLVSPA